jgi:hypothetical protein
MKFLPSSVLGVNLSGSGRIKSKPYRLPTANNQGTCQEFRKIRNLAGLKDYSLLKRFREFGLKAIFVAVFPALGPLSGNPAGRRQPGCWRAVPAREQGYQDHRLNSPAGTREVK